MMSYLTAAQLHTDSFSPLKDLLHVQFHRQLVDVLNKSQKNKQMRSELKLRPLTAGGGAAGRRLLLTLRISLKPMFSSIILCFSESRMEQQISRWKFSQGRPVHIT